MHVLVVMEILPHHKPLLEQAAPEAEFTYSSIREVTRLRLILPMSSSATPRPS